MYHHYVRSISSRSVQIFFSDFINSVKSYSSVYCLASDNSGKFSSTFFIPSLPSPTPSLPTLPKSPYNKHTNHTNIIISMRWLQKGKKKEEEEKKKRGQRKKKKSDLFFYFTDLDKLVVAAQLEEHRAYSFFLQHVAKFIGVMRQLYWGLCLRLSALFYQLVGWFLSCILSLLKKKKKI